MPPGAEAGMHHAPMPPEPDEDEAAAPPLALKRFFCPFVEQRPSHHPTRHRRPTFASSSLLAWQPTG